MAKAFDATLNTLIDGHVERWGLFLAARCGVPRGVVIALDTDLSATLQADRLFRIDGPTPAAIHLELESTGRLGIPDELLRYNVAARAVIELPVHGVLILLHPKANASDLTGLHAVAGADAMPYLIFRYTVVRVWQESVDSLLAAGPGIAPLAMLTDEAAADLPGAFGRLRDRLQTDGITDKLERGLLGSTFVLCGLRYSPSQIEDLYRELSMTLEDSTTYQLILNRGIKQGETRGEARGRAEGRAEEARAMVRLLGSQKFGEAPPAVEATLQGITDRERLERIAARLLNAASWDDLLGTP